MTKTKLREYCSKYKGSKVRFYGIIAQSKEDPSEIFGLNYYNRGEFSHGVGGRKVKDGVHSLFAFERGHITPHAATFLIDSSSDCQTEWNKLKFRVICIKQGYLNQRKRHITRYPLDGNPGKCYFSNEHDKLSSMKYSCVKQLIANTGNKLILKRFDVSKYNIFVVKIGSKSCPIELESNMFNIGNSWLLGAKELHDNNKWMIRVPFKVKDNFKCGGGN